LWGGDIRLFEYHLRLTTCSSPETIIKGENSPSQRKVGCLLRSNDAAIMPKNNEHQTAKANFASAAIRPER